MIQLLEPLLDPRHFRPIRFGLSLLEATSVSSNLGLLGGLLPALLELFADTRFLLLALSLLDDRAPSPALRKRVLAAAGPRPLPLNDRLEDDAFEDEDGEAYESAPAAARTPGR